MTLSAFISFKKLTNLFYQKNKSENDASAILQGLERTNKIIHTEKEEFANDDENNIDFSLDDCLAEITKKNLECNEMLNNERISEVSNKIFDDSSKDDQNKTSSSSSISMMNLTLIIISNFIKNSHVKNNKEIIDDKPDDKTGTNNELERTVLVLNNEIQRIHTENEWKNDAITQGKRSEYNDETEIYWVEFTAIFDREEKGGIQMYNISEKKKGESKCIIYCLMKSDLILICAKINELLEQVQKDDVVEINLPDELGMSEADACILEAIHSIYNAETIGNKILIKYDRGVKERIHRRLVNSAEAFNPAWCFLIRTQIGETCLIELIIVSDIGIGLNTLESLYPEPLVEIQTPRKLQLL
ncbi:hypothetical protein C1646_668550 [Rhizophagus diaphanus]|nr:hypothetical protein C1646_668550 [Rhizophagus diaphanus] [Rhizophagus sp. MUCL 43196]